MIKRWKLIRGWWRLKFGYCPHCDSSPPMSQCPVCNGSYIYGSDLDPWDIDVWRARYRLFILGPIIDEKM